MIALPSMRGFTVLWNENPMAGMNGLRFGTRALSGESVCKQR